MNRITLTIDDRISHGAEHIGATRNSDGSFTAPAFVWALVADSFDGSADFYLTSMIRDRGLAAKYSGASATIRGAI